MIRLLLVCWLLVGVWISGLGQPATISSLKSQLGKASNDTTRSRLLWELGQQYAYDDLDVCFSLLRQSLCSAQRAHDSFGTARAMYQLGWTYMYVLQDEGNTLAWTKKVIAVAKPKNDYVHLAKAMALQGIITVHQKFNNSEELVDRALVYAKKSANWEVLADVYSTQFGVYTSQKNSMNAERALYLTMVTYQNHNLDKWFTYALDYCDLLDKKKKYEQILVLSHQLDQMKDKLRKSDGDFVYRNDMARLATRLNHFAEAETMLLAGLNAEKRQLKPNPHHLYHYYKNLVNLYVKKGAYQQAYERSRNLADIQLILQEKRQTRDSKLQMTQLKSALDLEKKERELTEVRAQDKQKQGFLIAAGVLGLLLIGFVIVQRRNQFRIQRQKAELTSLNATKDKLFAILSHDLRSPVANLHSNLVLTQWNALSQDEFSASTKRLSKAIGTVRAMLDNVLYWALSQMDGMAPSPQPIEVAPLIDEQLAAWQPIAESKGVKLVNLVPPDVAIFADKNHLDLIFRNLIQNALKFTCKGGSITLGYLEKGAFCQFSVQDTGLGMGPDRLENLFQLNKQPSQLGTSFEPTTGLGLVLVKELVEANQGFIHVDSELNRGSTFTLSFSREFTKPEFTKKQGAYT